MTSNSLLYGCKVNYEIETEQLSSNNMNAIRYLRQTIELQPFGPCMCGRSVAFDGVALMLTCC